MTTPDPSPIISRPAPQAVTYDLTAPNRVRITLPRGSKWSSGLHWHERHTEYLLLVRGSIRVRLGDRVQILSAADGTGKDEEVVIPRGVWHEWCRADAEEKKGGEQEEVVVIERTDPEDGEKAVFFHNLNGVILQAQQGRAPVSVPGWVVDWWVSLRLWLIFGVLDNYPVLLGVGDAGDGDGVISRVGRWLDWVVTHAVLGLAGWAGWVSGMNAVRREFMPEEEWQRWVASKGGKEKGV
ncbi:hypothetical protein GE09DRAFT_980869 [Coniochaeta sp. 2T2.1]|nr:hypothetical protein GE09DRAFT_980869 [Coniochaeta sp. 2T2.1]